MDESPSGWQGMERWIERLGICLLNGRLPLPLPFSLLNESQFYSVSITREETSPSPGNTSYFLQAAMTPCPQPETCLGRAM